MCHKMLSPEEKDKFLKAMSEHEVLTSEEIESLLSGYDDETKLPPEDVDKLPEDEDDYPFIAINSLANRLKGTVWEVREHLLTSNFVEEHSNSEDIGELEEILTNLFAGKSQEVCNTVKELTNEKYEKENPNAYLKFLASNFLLINKILLEAAVEQSKRLERKIEDLHRQKDTAIALLFFE